MTARASYFKSFSLIMTLDVTSGMSERSIRRRSPAEAIRAHLLKNVKFAGGELSSCGV